MNVGEALARIELLFQTSLSFPKREIFRGAWKNLTYEAIIEGMIEQGHRGYDLSYIKAQGSELCRELTSLLNMQVKKRTFQEDVMEGLRRQAPRSPQISPELIPAEPAIALSTTPPALDSATIRWVGREDLVESLVQRLQNTCRVLMLVGLTGIGKTALSARLLTDTQLQAQFPTQKVVLCDRDLPNFEHLANEVLGATAMTDSELQRSPDQWVEAIIARLKTQPCLLVVDMAEEILASDDHGRLQFIDPAFAHLLDQMVRSEVMPSRIILTSQTQPPLPFQGRYPERSHLQRLAGLTEAEALQLFEEWGVAVSSQSLDREAETLLQRIICVFEGHPLALQVIAGEIQAEPYNGSIQAYWAEFGAEFIKVEQQKAAEEIEGRSDRPHLTCYRPQLQDIVRDRIEQTFQRLQQSNVLAYQLLLTAAIYRRAVEPAAWYCLLDEHPPAIAQQAFSSLERRYLIERERYHNQILYRQHSLIRCVALQHLHQTEEVAPL